MGSLWPAIIAATAALSGASITQFLQGRREKWRWQRDRGRDAEQRADVRNRDRELWAREDRHRFLESKRSTYAEYLRHLSELDSVLTYSAKSMRDVLGAPNADAEPFDAALLWHGAGIDERVAQQGQATERLRHVVVLIAPPIVSTTAELAQAKYLLTITKAIAGKDAEFEEERKAFNASRSRLLQLMRQDLGVTAASETSSTTDLTWAWIHRRNGCVDRVVTGQMPSELG